MVRCERHSADTQVCPQCPLQGSKGPGGGRHGSTRPPEGRDDWPQVKPAAIFVTDIDISSPSWTDLLSYKVSF